MDILLLLVVVLLLSLLQYSYCNTIKKVCIDNNSIKTIINNDNDLLFFNNCTSIEVFNEVNINSDEEISINEFIDASLKIGIKPDISKIIAKTFDFDQSGTLNKSEFAWALSVLTTLVSTFINGSYSILTWIIFSILYIFMYLPMMLLYTLAYSIIRVTLFVIRIMIHFWFIFQLSIIGTLLFVINKVIDFTTNIEQYTISTYKMMNTIERMLLLLFNPIVQSIDEINGNQMSDNYQALVIKENNNDNGIISQITTNKWIQPLINELIKVKIYMDERHLKLADFDFSRFIRDNLNLTRELICDRQLNGFLIDLSQQFFSNYIISACALYLYESYFWSESFSFWLIYGYYTVFLLPTLIFTNSKSLKIKFALITLLIGVVRYYYYDFVKHFFATWYDWTFLSPGEESEVELSHTTESHTQILFFCIVASLAINWTIAHFSPKDSTNENTKNMKAQKSMYSLVVTSAVLVGFLEYFIPSLCDYPFIFDPLTYNEVIKIVLSPYVFIALVVGCSQVKIYKSKQQFIDGAYNSIAGMIVSFSAGFTEEILFRWLQQPLYMLFIKILYFCSKPFDYVLSFFISYTPTVPFLIYPLELLKGFMGFATFGWSSYLEDMVKDYGSTYIYACILSDFTFSIAHAHQGFFGIFIKPIGCFYLRYFCLKYGLIASILAHFLWDACLMTLPFIISIVFTCINIISCKLFGIDSIEIFTFNNWIQHAKSLFLRTVYNSSLRTFLTTLASYKEDNNENNIIKLVMKFLEETTPPTSTPTPVSE